MDLKITNNARAPYGVETMDGGFRFIAPGETRRVDALNPGPLYRKPFLLIEAGDSEVTTPPKSMRTAAEKVGKPVIPTVEEVLDAEVVEEKPDPLDHDGKDGKGGSVKGFHSTAAKGARRRKTRKARPR